jgi:hypothetical protein
MPRRKKNEGPPATGPPPAEAPADARKADPGVQERYRVFSIEEHARIKGMWGGSQKRSQMELYGMIPTHGLESSSGPRPISLAALAREHTPALLHAFTEILVNAADHAVAHPGRGGVTRIEVAFDAAGRFTCLNDGPGIPVVRHEAVSALEGRDVYVPEVVFGFFLSGSNLEKPPDCVKGGINGVGAKLANVNSAEFVIRTVAGGLEYRQVFRDRMRARDPPAIAKAKGAKGLTEVSFLPAYAELMEGFDPAADLPEIEAWLRWQCALLAAYAGTAGRAGVTYNGAPVDPSVAAVAAALAGGVPHETTVPIPVFEFAMKPRPRPTRPTRGASRSPCPPAGGRKPAPAAPSPARPSA